MRQFLKYEFKNNWKQFLTSYILIIASFIVLSIFVMIVKDIQSPSLFMTILYANLGLLVFGAMIASAALFISNLVKSMYNSIFTDEGYLTLSFPKSTDSLIISKIIANIVWGLLYALATFIGLIILYLSLMVLFGEPINVMFAELYNLFSQIDFPISIIPLTLINGLVNVILNYILLLLAFSVINTGIAKKGKVGLGILLYFGFTFILSMVISFASFISFGFAINVDGDIVFTFGGALSNGFFGSDAVSYIFDFTSFFINVGCIIVGYILIRNIIQKHLEME